jgi:hypothetical protein
MLRLPRGIPILTVCFRALLTDGVKAVRFERAAAD